MSDERDVKPMSHMMERAGRVGGPGRGITADIDINKLERLAKLGHTQREIADFFGVATRTLEKYLSDEHPEYREAYNRGKIACRGRVRALQWRHAAGSGMAAVTMTIHMSKHQLGEFERVDIGQGNTTINIGEARELIDAELEKMHQAITIDVIDVKQGEHGSGNGTAGPGGGNGSLLGPGSAPGE